MVFENEIRKEWDREIAFLFAGDIIVFVKRKND